VAGFVYAFRSGEISMLCASAIAVPLLSAAVASAATRNERTMFPVMVCGSTFVFVALLLICAAPPVARRESVRDLLLLADARGYASAPVLAQRSDDRSAQFYAHDRVIYNAEGEPITFDEVTLEQARALGSRLVVLIPAEYANDLKGAPGIEIIGDNGRIAILGWTP
jgi:hypothetical protein